MKRLLAVLFLLLTFSNLSVAAKEDDGGVHPPSPTPETITFYTKEEYYNYIEQHPEFSYLKPVERYDVLGDLKEYIYGERWVYKFEYKNSDRVLENYIAVQPYEITQAESMYEDLTYKSDEDIEDQFPTERTILKELDNPEDGIEKIYIYMTKVDHINVRVHYHALVFVNEDFFENKDLAVISNIDCSKYTDLDISVCQCVFVQGGFVYNYGGKNKVMDLYYHDAKNKIMYTVKGYDPEKSWETYYTDNNEFMRSLVNLDTYKEAWAYLLSIPIEEINSENTDDNLPTGNKPAGSDTTAPGGDKTSPGDDKTDTGENAIGSDENEENKDSKTESVLPWVFLGAAGVLVLATALGILLHSRKKH